MDSLTPHSPTRARLMVPRHSELWLAYTVSPPSQPLGSPRGHRSRGALAQWRGYTHTTNVATSHHSTQMTAGFIGLGDQGAPTSPRRAQPWAHQYRADVEVAVSGTSGSVKPLPPEMEGLATATKAAGTAADATSGQGSGHDAPLAIEVLAASPRLERIKRPAARCLRARDKGLKHWELVSIEEQTELVVRLFTHPFRLTSPQPGELGAGLIAGVCPHGVHIVREVDQETVGCDGIDRIHSVRPGCAARDRLLNRVKREVRYRFVMARLELSHSRDRDGRLLAATHGIMELDPAVEPQTLSGALVAGEMSATTSD